MEDIVQDLIEYAVEFYCEGGVYQSFFNPTLTREEVEIVVKTINATAKIEFCDSIDRECVRDYIFLQRGEQDVEYLWLLKKMGWIK